MVAEVKLPRLARWTNPLISRRPAGEALTATARKLGGISLLPGSFGVSSLKKIGITAAKAGGWVAGFTALVVAYDHSGFGPLFGTFTSMLNDAHWGLYLGLPTFLIENRLNYLRRSTLAKSLMNFGNIEEVSSSWRTTGEKMRNFLLAKVKDPARKERFTSEQPEAAKPQEPAGPLAGDQRPQEEPNVVDQALEDTND
jgi:hypothetical protein